jgi:hypothetical protein
MLEAHTMYREKKGMTERLIALEEHLPSGDTECLNYPFHLS